MQGFSDSEWASLLETPMQVIFAVILADKVDPVSLLKEAQVAFQVLAAELQREDSGNLVQSVIVALNEAAAPDPLHADQRLLEQQFELLRTLQIFNGVSDRHRQAMAHLYQVKTMLVFKVLMSQVRIGQAEEFKQWLLALATQVFQAVKDEKHGKRERFVCLEARGLSDIEKMLNVQL